MKTSTPFGRHSPAPSAGEPPLGLFMASRPVLWMGDAQGGREGGSGLIIMELALLIKFNQFKAVFWVLNFITCFIAWS